MTTNLYNKKIEQLLYAYEQIKFTEINDLKFVKGFNYSSENYKILAEFLREGGVEKISDLDEGEKAFEDVSVYTFSDEVGKKYVVAIYDSDELMQDPKVLDIFMLK